MINFAASNECIYLIEHKDTKNKEILEIIMRAEHREIYNANNHVWIKGDEDNSTSLIASKYFVLLSNKDLTKFFISESTIEYYDFLKIFKKLEFLKKLKSN